MIIFEKEDKDISIGIVYNFLNLKNPCLVVKDGNRETRYASFVSKEAADEFVQIFGNFLNARLIK